MKAFILSVFAFATVANAAVIPWPAATTALVRTPSLDSAVIQSERLNGAFSYSTVENQAYAPVIQTYATYPLNYIPNVIYPQQYYPTYTIIQPSIIPGFGGSVIPGSLPSPGQGPQQPPVEVEDPADNTENKEDNNKENNNNGDDDTVAVESI